MPLSPQATRVLKHLRATGSITNVEANAVHGIRSVSRRITEIREAGYGVEKQQKRDTVGQRYVRYVLDAANRACACNLCTDADKVAA